MRVLLDVSAVPARPVGAGVYTVALAGGLALHPDVDLHLLTRRCDTQRWFTLAPGAAVHAEAPDRRIARLAWEQAAAHRFAARIGFDVWHGPHYTMPLRLGLPSVVTIHDLTFFDHPEWHERTKVAFFKRMIRASAARANVLVCVSSYTARRLHAVTRVAGDVVVAHHGVDHERFTPHADRAADLEVLSMHGITPPYIAFAGTIEPRKDVPTLVAAFARIASAHPELRLVLAGGDGWGVDDARAAIARSGVATRILRPGYLDNAAIPAFFRRAEAVAYPSLAEGFGLPALEALACGSPLVTTSGSSLDEVVGDAALLVAPGNVGDLAGALEIAIGANETASRLREAGPKRAASFTWEDCIEQHVHAYRSAAGSEAAA